MIGLHLAEVAPLAPPVIEALPFLLALAGLLFAVGCVKLIDGFVRALFGTAQGAVGWIPFAGKVIKSPIHKIEQKVTHFLGRAEQGLDNYIGLCFHNLAHLVRMFAREIEGLAHDLWLVSAVIPTLVGRLGLNYLVRGIRSEIKAWLHLLRRVERLANARIHTVEHTITHNVFPRVRAGDAALDRVIEWDIPNLRARTRELEREYARLHRWTLRHARTIATAAFVGAVAIALRKLGGGWIRCRNWRRIGKHVCGLPIGLIEDLLGVAFDALLLRDLCQMVGVIQGIARRVAPEINALVLEVEGYICGGHGSAAKGIVDADWQRVSARPSGLLDSEWLRASA